MRKTLSLLAIIAALSSSALATSSATLSGGTIVGVAYVGDGNVTIAEGGSTFDVNMVFGKMGANPGASVSNATVMMTGGTLECGVCGGMADGTGNATTHTVTISGGSVSANVYGGSALGGDANLNTVTISGGAVQSKVYGGFSTAGSASLNTVTISGGEVTGEVHGGKSGSSDASYNTITITGGTINDDVFGGSGMAGNASNNTVTISGGQQNGYVYGGKTAQGNANNNTLTIESGSVEYSVYGGSSNQGNANNNTVTISGGSVNDYVYGGISGYAAANGNTVTISGGTLSSAVQGGHGETEANNNTVTISGGTVSYNVSGGFSSSGDVNGNTITVSGGSVTGDIYGGYSSSGKATGNTVTISGGEVTGGVYGGFSGNGSIATNNTVNLVGEGATLGTLTGSSFTIDGVVFGNNTGSVTDNTLNVYGKGITVSGIVSQFETANFYLAPNIQNGDTILTSQMFVANKVNVKCDGDTLLNDGDTVTLVHTTDAYVSYNQSNVDIIKGVTASYSGKVTTDGTDIVLTVGGTPTPSGVKVETNTLKSMTETRTDVAALVNSAADFMATTGVQQAKLAAKVAALAGKDGAAPFMAMGGSSMRYNTGSHVDADGFNGALGVAKSFGETTLGIAGEYGLSSYKSYVGGVRGKGDSKLYGGALLADWQGTQGWHAEGAVRVGRTSTDYSAMTPLGYTHYTDHASYQGALIGGGKEFKVSRKSDDTVDLYARYMYSHTNASNTKATSGESMHFAGVDSHRTMVGARYNHELTDKAVVYAGIAWMHEFNGDAHSVIGGFTSPSPSLEGDSGMVEIGTTFAPCRSENILLNLNVQGWSGVQRGISGGAGCTIKF